MKTDYDIEKKVVEQGLTAPRITVGQIDALYNTLELHTHHFEGTTTVVAIAVLPNGFVVGTGTAACASPANFKLDIGMHIATDKALANAREELWKLEGYALKKTL